MRERGNTSRQTGHSRIARTPSLHRSSCSKLSPSGPWWQVCFHFVQSKRPFFSFYHNLTLKWVSLTLESVAALAKSTFSLTWTFLLCSARVYNTLKIAFPQIKSRQSSRLISVNQRPFHLNIKDKKYYHFPKLSLDDIERQNLTN